MLENQPRISLTKLVNRDYVKRINDSPDSAIHSTFSHFAAFFIVAVTKRFYVGRNWRISSQVHIMCYISHKVFIRKCVLVRI